jgi:hypothetical protein
VPTYLHHSFRSVFYPCSLMEVMVSRVKLIGENTMMRKHRHPEVSTFFIRFSEEYQCIYRRNHVVLSNTNFKSSISTPQPFSQSPLIEIEGSSVAIGALPCRHASPSPCISLAMHLPRNHPSPLLPPFSTLRAVAHSSGSERQQHLPSHIHGPLRRHS